MAVRRKPKMAYQRPVVAIEHTGFYPSVRRYIEAMKIRHIRGGNLRRRDSVIRVFVAWCETRGLDRPQEVTRPVLESYQKHLYYYRQVNGEPLAVITQARYMSVLKQYFKWLSQANELLSNPASELVLPKIPRHLPTVLTVEEIERLLAQPDIKTLHGIRDRAILEVFYSTGLRRFELVRLQVVDVAIGRQTLFVREGKGGKDRLLPIGTRALHWLQHYLKTVRPQLLVNLHEQAVFLNNYGEPYPHSKVGDSVKRYMKKAGITALGSCHLLRHAMATHMLENGAGIRYIQAMLGHSSLKSTQVYTHVSIRKLQEIHAATHPAVLEGKDKDKRLDEVSATLDN